MRPVISSAGRGKSLCRSAARDAGGRLDVGYGTGAQCRRPSRLLNMIAGVTMALAILLFGRLVGMLAMPALAGLLIVVGFRMLKLDQVKMVWKTGSAQQVVMGITFVAASFVPLQFAVLIGVVLAVLLFVLQQSNKITVVAWKVEPGRYPLESAPPAAVPANASQSWCPMAACSMLRRRCSLRSSRK